MDNNIIIHCTYIIDKYYETQKLFNYTNWDVAYYESNLVWSISYEIVGRGTVSANDFITKNCGSYHLVHYKFTKYKSVELQMIFKIAQTVNSFDV